jgi:hypothetical protein
MRDPPLLLDASDPRGWERAIAPARDDARALLAAFQAEVRAAARGALGPLSPAAPAAAGALGAVVAALHRARGAPRQGELASIGRALGAPRGDLLVANLAYDLAAVAPLALALQGPGCSTLVADGPAGPLHARNLDWRFPGDLLRRHVRVVVVRGAPAGPYAIVGWPGLVGALTAVAPGRFSVSVNFVRLRGESLPRLLARAAAGALPVPFAVRDALDLDRSYERAVARLSDAPLLAPTILTLAGARSGEGCVVERAAGAAALRRLTAAGLCATNHALAGPFAGRSIDYDAGSSLARLAALAGACDLRPPATPRAALAALGPTVREELTQHQVVMRAADGLLVVRVPGQRARRVRF